MTPWRSIDEFCNAARAKAFQGDLNGALEMIASFVISVLQCDSSLADVFSSPELDLLALELGSIRGKRRNALQTLMRGPRPWPEKDSSSSTNTQPCARLSRGRSSRFSRSGLAASRGSGSHSGAARGTTPSGSKLLLGTADAWRTWRRAAGAPVTRVRILNAAQPTLR